MKQVVWLGFCLICLITTTTNAPGQSGIVSTVAGDGNAGFSGDGGPATSAELRGIRGVAVDAEGNLFIADVGNQRVRKVTPGGVISTIAGNGTAGFSGDRGPATSGELNFPLGVAVDAAGNIFIADTLNSLVRIVTPDGVISTFAGNGRVGFEGDGGEATSAQMRSPQSVAVDAAGNVFIADVDNHRIRRVTPNGVIDTVAGSGSFGPPGGGFGGDGGPATSARLNIPQSVAVDTAGNLYVADTNNHRVRKVTPGGFISTLAGNGTPGFSGDGGEAASAQLNFPIGVAADAAGNVFIADHSNFRVRKVDPQGVISTVAGNGTIGSSGDGGEATSAQLVPFDVALDAAGNLFISDPNGFRVRKVRGSGTRSRSDFNGDGKTDVLWRDSDGNVSMWVIDGTTVTNDSFIANVWTGWTIVGNGDFNGNGTADILWRDSAGNVAIWLMDGTNISISGSPGSMPPTSTVVGVADFNADGLADILWRDTGGDVHIWLMNAYTFGSNSFVANVWPGWIIAGCGDFNGDGKADILWRDSNGTVAIWFMDGTNITSLGDTGNMPATSTVAAFGDFDGNGKSDILWRDSDGNVAIWLMAGNTIVSSSFIANVWTGWAIAGSGDFNADGKTDILWRDTSGNVSIWLMEGAGIASYGEMGNVSDRMAQ